MQVRAAMSKFIGVEPSVAHTLTCVCSGYVCVCVCVMNVGKGLIQRANSYKRIISNSTMLCNACVIATDARFTPHKQLSC